MKQINSNNTIIQQKVELFKGPHLFYEWLQSSSCAPLCSCGKGCIIKCRWPFTPWQYLCADCFKADAGNMEANWISHSSLLGAVLSTAPRWIYIHFEKIEADKVKNE